MCAFTPQYYALQVLCGSFRDRGLVVLAEPSDDFGQELKSAEEVRAFCEINLGLDLPMTDITRVRGPDAHPFHRSLADTQSVNLRWDFNKVLIGRHGSFVGFLGSHVRPDVPRINALDEALLPK